MYASTVRRDNSVSYYIKNKTDFTIKYWTVSQKAYINKSVCYVPLFRVSQNRPVNSKIKLVVMKTCLSVQNKRRFKII